MKRGLQGEWTLRRIPGEQFQAFLPKPLPVEPPLVLDNALSDLLEQANRALGRLDGVASLLPDLDIFLYLYVRKEAVLSSQIEGTQSSLSDLLLFESNEVPGVPLDDVREVSQYVAALNYGMERIRGGFPLSSRLLREVHNVLLSHGRGSEHQPGEFRHSQNWIGGTRPGDAAFVPPPHEEIDRCMGALENFIHDMGSRTPTLIKAALSHVQFETIHPFLDGNGRIGRLLITLLLCQEDALKQPLLYLSYFLKKHRAEYYKLLTRVRQEGDWEAWLSFFLEGISATADQAATTAQKILQLFERDRHTLESLGRTAGTTLRVHHAIQRRPLFTISQLVEATGITFSTVNTAITAMQTLGMVQLVSGKQRDRRFVYQEYLDLLNEGTEPLPR
jgi:Fic family protein